jgi:branched-chain amino acid transport system substrate-binding protein
MLIGALMAVVAALTLSACGGSSDSSSSTDTASTGSEGGGGAATSAEAKEFLKYTGISEKAAEALKGQTFKLGAILPLTGAGAGFATEEQNGVLLAQAQMEEYLGLNVDYQVLDHKTGDPQAGAAAARQLGIDGFGTAVNSYYAVFGSTLPELQKYKVLSIDPGGGTGNLLKGQEYFWGGRANTPDDAFPGLRYFKETGSGAKKVALVDWEAGSEYYEPVEKHFKEEADKSGLTFAGAVHTKIGETDYSAAISELRALDPDVIWLAVYGTEPGYFMKQYVTSGMTAQVVGSEYTPTGAKVAGSAYDEYIFAQDYFDFEKPTNPFAKFFLKTYEEHFGEPAEVFFEPNYYEAGIVYAILAARIAEEGGDINSGELMNEKLEEDPEFASLYGGSETEAGKLAFDTKTHDPSLRPVAMFRATTPQELLAEWNIGGTDFKVIQK